MQKIFGDKELFAIEYKINASKPRFVGYMCFWIGNAQVGDLKEEVLLSTIQRSLTKLVDRIDDLSSDEMKKEAGENKDLFETVLTIDDNGKFILNLAETFDKFEAFVFKNEDNLQFFWRFFGSKESYYKTVPVQSFLKVTKECIESLDL